MSDDDPKMTNGPTGFDTEELGIAGKMARSFIHSPLSPLLFFAMLAMGVLGLVFTPRQEDPQISVPMVDIMVAYPGATSEQVSSLAIEPLERIMSEIPGVKHVYSASMHDQGMVTVQFIVGEDLGPSIVKVHDKIQSNLDKIPSGVQMPLVKPKGIDDVPVVTFTLWSEDVDDSMLHTLGLDLLQSLKQIPNTGQGFVVGGRSEQVRVEVMPERLSGYGLSLDQLANTIRTANSEKTVGNLESGNSYFTVQTGAFLRSAEDVARLVVSTQNSIPVYVRDVAKVFQGPEETKQIVQYYTGPAYGADSDAESLPYADGTAAVTVAMSKKVGSNGVSVAEAIIDKLETLKGRLIPDNVNVDITRNYGASANEKVNDLIFKLFVATGAVGVLILYFLGFRPAIVVLMVIPVVIVFTVFAAWIMGFTIDRVSLFALIFCIGILVDDAIVVVENIYRRWLAKGEMSTEVAIDAVREVGNPTILATFTVIAALLPMGAVSGMMGPYMAPIPALGSVAMLVSLVAAFIFTPWLAMRIKPSMEQLHKAEEKEERSAARLEGIFRSILMPIIGNKKIGYLTLGSIVFLFFAVCVLFYTNSVRVKMLPLDNKPEYSIVVDMPEGTALPDTANMTSKLVEIVRQYPEVVAVQSYVGTAQPFDFNGMVRHYYLRSDPWQAEIHVQLVHKSKRDTTSHDLAVMTREAIAPIMKEARARATVVEMPPGPPVLQAMVAEVYGPDDETRRAVAQHMTDTFDRAEGVGDVDNYMPEEYNVWRFEVDIEKAVRRGISVDTINRNLSMAMGDYVLGDIKQGNVLDPTNIVIQIPLDVRSEIARLGDLPIPSTTGTTIPLAELGYFKQVKQDPIIYHKDLRPVEYVVGEAIGRLAAPIYGMFEVEELLKDYTTPDGVKLKGSYFGAPDDDGTSAFEWAGEWTVTLETFAGMGGAFGVAIILIYILVVWEFGNFMIPAIIMAPIPLTLIGIIPGHWLLDAEFTATSMIGFIALAGIIVRNSILLVDYSIQQVQEGEDVRDAVIMACKARTRPIVITAFALVGGSSVILTDPIFQGMAISLLFGVLVSTLLTLIVIPLGCISARSTFCPAGSECEQTVNECECEDVPAESKLSIGDFLVGIWRLVVMMLQGLGFKLYQLVISFIFGVVGRISSLRSRSEPTPQPVVQPEPVPSEQTTSATPVVDEPSSIDVAAADVQHDDVIQQQPSSKEDTTEPSPSSVPAPILEEFEKKTQDADVDSPQESNQVVEKVSVPDETTPVNPKKVVKKRVVKKSVAKKKIAVKRVAPKKKVAIKKKSATSKRRGIRLNRNFDDFDI